MGFGSYKLHYDGQLRIQELKIIGFLYPIANDMVPQEIKT